MGVFILFCFAIFIFYFLGLTSWSSFGMLIPPYLLRESAFCYDCMHCQSFYLFFLSSFFFSSTAKVHSYFKEKTEKTFEEGILRYGQRTNQHRLTTYSRIASATACSPSDAVFSVAMNPIWSRNWSSAGLLMLSWQTKQKAVANSSSRARSVVSICCRVGWVAETRVERVRRERRGEG